MSSQQQFRRDNCVVSENSYERLAAEYYDPILHPTCANFRTASAVVLAHWLLDVCTRTARLVEVGAGKSLLLEYLVEHGCRVQSVLVTDSSPKMLEHSRGLGLEPTQFLIAPAYRIPVPDGSVSALVASLGDPYNTNTFWAEAHRVLEPNGHVIFTTPSWEWSSTFRQANEGQIAEFVMSDGTRVDVPSLILSLHEQEALIESTGLELVNEFSVTANDLGSHIISPKLAIPRDGHQPIVRGFLVVRPV